MKELIDYILAHTERGECQCGRCADKGAERPAPSHSVNIHFFWVSVKGSPSQKDLHDLLERHYPDMGRLRRGPSYMEMGAALGDQGLALLLIGLGELVGLWRAVTPERLGFEGADATSMAGSGLVNAGTWLGPQLDEVDQGAG